MENGKPDWELQKENIQPLSAGRNISLLKHSLETSKNMADYEADMDHQIKTFEAKAKDYDGEDPLEPWITLIHFLENSCLLNAHLKTKLQNSLMKCVKIFNVNSKYQNDKRFIDVFLKCMNEWDAGPRVKIIQNALSKGTGKTVSQMYIAIAELQESLGKRPEAVQTLKLGIANEAQPIEKLKDALSQLEYRVVESLALTFKLSDNKNAGDSRQFGSSVPVYGEKNDAPVFRSDLDPAVPVVATKPTLVKRQGLKPIEVFSEVNESPSLAKPAENLVVQSENKIVEDARRQKTDRENKLRPSKWNKPEVVLNEDREVGFSEPAPPRLQLYSESSEANTVQMPAVQAGILRERKEESPSELTELAAVTEVVSQPSSTQVSASTVSKGSQQSNLVLKCAKTIFMNGKEVSFEHRRRDIWLAKQKETQNSEFLNLKIRELEEKLSKKENEFISISTLKDQLVAECTELKSKTMKSELKVKELAELLESERLKCAKLESKCISSDSKMKQLVEHLEREIKHKDELISEWSQKEQNFLEKIEMLTSLLSQPKVSISSSSGPSSSDESTVISRPQVNSAEAVNVVEKIRDSYNYNKSSSCMQQEMSFRRGDCDRSARETFNASVKMNETDFCKADSGLFNFNESVAQPHGLSVAEVSDFLPPPRAIARKLPFTLYESHMESFSSSSRNDNLPNPPPQNENKFQMYCEKPQPDFKNLTENIPPWARTRLDITGESQVDKQATPSVREEIRSSSVTSGSVGQTFIRPTIGVTPSYNRLSQPVHDENEIDEEVTMSQQYGDQLDFNVSNLTRALAFFPEPLLNSTPERKGTQREPEFEKLRFGNYIHTQKLPLYRGNYGGSISDRDLNNDQRTNGPELNLSPIQETSKENRSSASCTTGSSSGNMTSTRGGSSSSCFSTRSGSVSGGPPRSISRYQFQ